MITQRSVSWRGKGVGLCEAPHQGREESLRGVRGGAFQGGEVVFESLLRPWRDPDKFDSEAPGFDPPDGRQFDLDRSGLGGERNLQRKIFSAGDGEITEDRRPSEREILHTSFSLDRVTRKHDMGVVRESLKFSVFHPRFLGEWWLSTRQVVQRCSV